MGSASSIRPHPAPVRDPGKRKRPASRRRNATVRDDRKGESQVGLPRIRNPMNKAFTRDPEPEEPRCPPPAGCGGPGMPVGRKTLLAQLPESLARAFSESAYYCPNPRCNVAYFDAWGAQAPASVLRRTSYPKTPAAPLCSCFGITAEQIRDEAKAGRKDLIRDLVARAA